MWKQMQDRRFADSRALSEATRCLSLSVHLSVSVTPYSYGKQSCMTTIDTGVDNGAQGAQAPPMAGQKRINAMFTSERRY